MVSTELVEFKNIRVKIEVHHQKFHRHASAHKKVKEHSECELREVQDQFYDTLDVLIIRINYTSYSVARTWVAICFLSSNF